MSHAREGSSVILRRTGSVEEASMLRKGLFATCLVSSALAGCGAETDSLGESDSYASASPRKNVFIGYRQSPSQSDKNRLAQLGASVRHEFASLNAIAVSADDSAISALGRDSRVLYVEDDPPR